jgi:ribonucleoside-diphosphate reductase alpha chain
MAPMGCVTQDNLDSMDHLDLWLEYQKHWCDHKPSITVSYTDKDFMAIGDWVWKNWDYVSGVSFLPHDDNVYDQAPFESVSEQRYKELTLKTSIDLDWTQLSVYETEDHTTSSQELACHGGACEVIDLTENTNATA